MSRIVPVFYCIYIGPLIDDDRFQSDSIYCVNYPISTILFFLFPFLFLFLAKYRTSSTAVTEFVISFCQNFAEVKVLLKMFYSVSGLDGECR